MIKVYNSKVTSLDAINAIEGNPTVVYFPCHHHQSLFKRDSLDKLFYVSEDFNGKTNGD